MADTQGRQAGSGHGMDERKETHQGQATGVTAEAEQQDGQDGQAFEPPSMQKSSTSESKKGPEGGYDDTPIARREPGYTVKFTFHRANNLPLADINTLSADPFILAELTTALPTRHKEDPPLTLRTRTVRQNTNPQWEQQWLVANVPATGFRLKCRIYDEDPADHDDRLGNVHVESASVNEHWAGIRQQAFPLRKRMVSKRAFVLRAVAVCIRKAEHMNGTLTVSAEVLGRSRDEHGGRCYTIGPQFWIRHYSPLLGRLLGQKEPDESGSVSRRTGKTKAERYNFQSNQLQLRGPVPEHMYHRYVVFKPFVKSMFTAKGVRGFILSKALHHQHARVYNFDHATEYHEFPAPCRAFTQKFLDLVHYDQGGRIFTYVLTLDALFRFTETGKEFGIDMLSKHTMHSDVAAYIAFSGEFFVRRLRHPNKSPEDPSQASHPPQDMDGGPPKQEPTKTDPSYYELIIDNDSGTYRPNAKLLPQLKAFFSANFPGLHIRTLDCQGDAEKMAHMKHEQRERKKKEGDHVIYTQASRSSSVSSSDISELDHLEQADEHELDESHLRHQVQGVAGAKAGALKHHVADFKPHNNNEGWRGTHHDVNQDNDDVERLRREDGQSKSGQSKSGQSKNGQSQEPQVNGRVESGEADHSAGIGTGTGTGTGTGQAGQA